MNKKNGTILKIANDKRYDASLSVSERFSIFCLADTLQPIT
jgi:hypothetical protein